LVYALGEPVFPQVMKGPSKIIVSIDLDMWYHCRWATGSEGALWKDTSALYADYYQSDRPGTEIETYTDDVLALLQKYGIRATFFVLGEVAELFPRLIRRINREGHEIGCHGWYHVDSDKLGEEEFRAQVGRAKQLLEDLTGRTIEGFRVPNLVIPSRFPEIIRDLGFSYDSSICPSRRFFGKYSGLMDYPVNPFLFKIEGLQPLVEIPIPVFPLFRLPACSGIVTRVFGGIWTMTALRSALKGGDAMYYFHPYEIGQKPDLPKQTWYIRIFFRNIGDPFISMLDRILAFARERGTITAGEAARSMLKQYQS